MIIYHYSICIYTIFIILCLFLSFYCFYDNISSFERFIVLRCTCRSILYLWFLVLFYLEISYAKIVGWISGVSFFFFETFIWKYILNFILLAFIAFSKYLFWFVGLDFRISYWALNFWDTLAGFFFN